MSAPVKKEELQGDTAKILPIYIVVDRSWSMKDDGKIEAANELIPAITDACIENPVAEDRSRFCIIAFNDQAEVVAPLSEGSNLPENYTFVASSGTSYTNVFRLLRERLETDYQTLKADGSQVYRPAVFMITDGEPICNAAERAAAFAELTDPTFPRYPLISLFGVGNDVSHGTLAQYVWRNPTSAEPGKLCGEVIVTRDGQSPGEALQEFIPKLIQSLVQSLASAAGTASSDDGVSEIQPIDPNLFTDFDLAT